MTTNRDRADFANAGVGAYYDLTRHSKLGPSIDDVAEWEEVLGDLVCDLRHLADRRGVDWETVMLRAGGHYLAELAEAQEEALLLAGGGAQNSAG